MIKIEEVKNNLKEVGYFASDKLAKAVALFEAAGRRSSSNIPAILLEGDPGAGKTFLAESFANIVGAEKLFLQCYKGIGSDNLIIEPNISAIIKKDSDHAINNGILVSSLIKSSNGPVVVILDEVDKADAAFDALLLDFLNSGRITNGITEWHKGSYPIWVFLTSNNERELSDALINRCRRQHIERVPKETFLNALGLDKDIYNIGLIYEKFPTFSIRQAKAYIEDLEVLGEIFDKDVLSQYVNLDSVDEINSLEELKMFQKTEKINYLDIDINEDVRNWILENPEEISLVEDKNDIKSRIDSLETLEEMISDSILIEGYSSYEEYDLLVEEKYIAKKVICKNIGVFYIEDSYIKESFVGKIIDDNVYIKMPGRMLDEWLNNDDDDYNDDYDDDGYND